MEALTFEAKIRSVTGKQVRRLRREGGLPGVIYGRKIEPIPIELDLKDAQRLLARATGATLFDLRLGEDVHKVLVREIQRDALSRQPIHVDFLKVAMDQAIRAAVPIEFVGEAPAVRTLGGVLVTGLSEVEVEALPADLPDRIEVSLESLTEIDSSIKVKDLSLGEKVEILTDLQELIARVIYGAAEEVEEAPVVAVEVEEPEVIGRGKREEEEEEAEAEE